MIYPALSDATALCELYETYGHFTHFSRTYASWCRRSHHPMYLVCLFEIEGAF